MKNLVLSILILSATTLLGQGSNSIQGKVIDETTQQPIIGANVIVEDANRGSATDVEGNFYIQSMPVGTYRLRVDYIGYASRIISDIVVKSNRPAVINIELQETILELEAAVVIAEYFTKSPDTPSSTQVQSSEEIRRLPGGFEGVVRAISILPGVAQADGGRNDLIVRGGAPSENLYIIDNIEVPNINHFGTQGASGGPQSYVNLDFVDETSFSTGGFTAKYGDRLSSVLDISLREGLSDQLASKTTISASQFGFNLEGALPQNGNFLFSARRSYLDFLFKAAGFGFVPEYWDFLTKATFNLNQTDQLTFLGIAALNNVKWFNDTKEQRNSNSQILGSDQQQFVAGINYRHLMSSGLFTTSLSQVNVEYDFLQRNADLTPIFSNRSYDRQTSLKSDVTWKLSKSLRLSTGGKISRADFYSDLVLNQNDVPGIGSFSIEQEYAKVGYKSGIYGQLSQRFVRFNYTAGLRADHSTFLDAAPVLSPRFSMNYDLTGDVSVSTSVGRYNQYPSTIWLVSNESNRDLDPIQADQFVLGLEYLWRSDTKVTLEAYTKQYRKYPVSLTRDYLVMVNTGAGFGGSTEGFASFGVDPLSSEGTGWARGLEFFVQKKMSEVPCYGTISVSYNQSMFKALDGIERPGSFDQTWIMNLGGGYVFNEKWEFSTKFRYASGRPYTPLNDSGMQITEAYNALRLDANHNLDVRLDRRWTNKGWGLITYIDVQNVYNRKSSSAPSFDPNTGKVAVNQGFGILPTIGISAEI
ncbi:MAG: TonB-dependent receptor [Candidatus Marinimicrobia bacterium]|nr:TonB-dependent receptor [FCB group bacterium]MBL7025230.1 TonB-dependent receptor [Candidatus Neomarinimicrobiota bacterium]